MKTILLNVKTTDKETQERANAYRSLWRASIVVIAVLSFMLGMLLAHIDHLSYEDSTDSQATETEVITFEAEHFMSTPEPEPEPKPEPEQTEPSAFFDLTPEQRTLVEQVVSAESRGEPYDGQVAVAQCILNACLKDDITPERAIKKYKYTGARVEATDSVKKAVAAVFDRGEGVTDEPILFFYAPARVTSEWHESQIFVVEIKNHRFFKEAA